MAIAGHGGDSAIIHDFRMNDFFGFPVTYIIALPVPPCLSGLTGTLAGEEGLAMRSNFFNSRLKPAFILLTIITLGVFVMPCLAADDEAKMGYYDEAAYTEFVESKMEKLDRLYLEFCDTCGMEGAKAAQARKEFLAEVRDLMKYMNARFDSLDPKAGAALSPTETLVSVHALTMLVDILAATEMQHEALHPYIE